MFDKVRYLFKKKYKYTTVFAATNFRIYDPLSEDKFIAQASQENLKNYLPDIDFEKNYDLLGISFGGYLTSKTNLNGQVITGRAGKNLAPTMVNKFIDIEHKRKDIRGVITNYAYADPITEAQLTDEEVEARISTETPYLVCFGGIIWRMADQDFAEELEMRNAPFSDLTPIKSSWECGFSEFQIAEGSKNLAEARVINDEKEIQDTYECLAHFGGPGKKNGKDVYLLLNGEVLGLAMGLTLRPAQPALGPVLVMSSTPKELQEKEENDESVINATQDNTMKVKAEDELERDEDEIKEKEKKAEKGKKDYSDKQREHFEENKVEIEEEEDDDDEVEGRKKKKVAVNEEGKSDETKWGPTKSPIVDTAFSKLTDIESRLKTTIKAFSKNNLNDAQIKARFDVLKTIDLKEVFSWDENNFESNYCSVVANLSKKSKESVNKKEKSEKDCVIAKTTNKKTSMKLTDIKELTDEKLVAGEITAGVIADFLGTKIDDLSAEWAKKEKEKADALALATEQAGTIKAELDRVSAELETLRNEAVAREKAEVFNTRIAALAEDFEFSDEQREIVASEIKDLDSESFDKYLKKLELFAKKKMKQGEKDREDEKLGDEVKNLKKEEKKDAKASEVFASLQVDADQVVPPNVAAPLESLKERWAAGFANGGVKVSRG